MNGRFHVKRVRALHQKKFRAGEGLFLVQGRKPVRELLASALRVDTIYATADAAADMRLHDAVVLPAHDLERMGTFEHGNEVVAVAHIPQERPMSPPRAGELVLALDGIGDPGNLGTLLRIADWFGVAHVWCSSDCVDAYNPKCVQASMGSLFRVGLSYGDLAAGLLGALGAEVSVFKAEASGQDVFTTPLSRPAVLVLGSESHGLSDAVRNAPGTSVAVPRYGSAESLNVAAAAAALCIEFARRR
ncbi:MAG: RNA methyltransferase [Flavobacteriales bacterium]